MFNDVIVNLATFLNIVTYILILFIIIAIYRFLVSKLYVNKIANKIRNEVIKVFSTHYLEYGLENREELVNKIYKLNKILKNKYNLCWSPVDINEDDIISYKSYFAIAEDFKIKGIRIRKNLLFYKINITKFSYYKNPIRYKDSVKENRDSKISDLIG